jgi:hypothetical protein
LEALSNRDPQAVAERLIPRLLEIKNRIGKPVLSYQ